MSVFGYVMDIVMDMMDFKNFYMEHNSCLLLHYYIFIDSRTDDKTGEFLVQSYE